MRNEVVQLRRKQQEESYAFKRKRTEELAAFLRMQDEQAKKLQSTQEQAIIAMVNSFVSEATGHSSHQYTELWMDIRRAVQENHGVYDDNLLDKLEELLK